MRDRDRITFRSLAMGLTLALALGAVAAPALASDRDDLVERTDTTYRLLPDEGVVRATSQLKLTNKAKPVKRTGSCKNGRGRCTTTTDYYFHSWNSFWAPADAINVAVGGPKVTALPAQEHGNGFAYHITYPKLWNKKKAKQNASFSFDLKAGTVEDTDKPTRIEDGYAHFCWWGQIGDTGVTRAVLPPGWEPMDRRDGVAIERGADGVVLRAKSKKNPSKFIDCEEVYDPSRLDRIYITGLDGQSLVVVESWAGDEAWAADMAGVAAEVLPNLESLLGSAMPYGELRVREVATQSRRFRNGDIWPSEGVLGMCEDADAATFLPTRLARAWIDPLQVTDRWLAEGLIGWLATQVTPGTSCQVGGEYPGLGAPDLDEWAEIMSFEDVPLSQWQLTTACELVAAGAEVIGDEAMTELIVELIEAPVPVGTGHWLAGVSRELPEGLDEFVAALDAAGVDH